MDSSSSIENLLFILRNKAHPLLSDANEYSSLVNFITGYELGMTSLFESKIPTINDWLRLKEEKNFSASWSFYFLQRSNAVEEVARKMLLDHFESYLNECVELHVKKND